MDTYDHILWWLIFLAAIGCGLMGGVFFAFSNFVMRGLARIDPAGGMAAMKSINRTVINPLFMLGFLGTTLLCVIVIAMAAMRWHVGSTLVLAGCALYVTGNFLVTLAGNVPLNNALDRVDVNAPEARETWQRYLVTWTRWNHIRTVSALAAMALLIPALARHDPSGAALVPVRAADIRPHVSTP